MSYDIETVSDVVDELGGPVPAGEWAGCGPGGICNWVARGYIPPSRHLKLILLLAERGKTWNPRLFELTEDEQAILDRIRIRRGRRGETRASA